MVNNLLNAGVALHFLGELPAVLAPPLLRERLPVRQLGRSDRLPAMYCYSAHVVDANDLMAYSAVLLR